MTLQPSAPPSFTPQAIAGFLLAALGPQLGYFLLHPGGVAVDLSNIALLNVLGMVVVALHFGRTTTLAAAVISSVSFVYIFVPPHFSLAITEGQYLLNASIMLLVALMVSHLTSRLRQHTAEVERKSTERKRLYELARGLAGARSHHEMLRITSDFLHATFAADDVHIVSGSSEDMPLAETLRIRIQSCMSRQQLSIAPSENGRCQVCLPLIATEGPLGALTFTTEALMLDGTQRTDALFTAASVLAVTLERARFVAHAQESEIRHAAETLRSSMLAALSHDLRTPLTALVGMAENLARGAATDATGAVSPAALFALRDQALSLSGQMTKVLDMTKLSAGNPLSRDWQPIEEVIGSALRLITRQWPARQIEVDIESSLPPVEIDAVLIERVLWNLLENAIKYAPPTQPITLTARRLGNSIEVAIHDRGPGLPATPTAALFDRFVRGHPESDIPGLGLGLSIARSIVEAHQGLISAENRSGGGSSFRFRLPLGEAPDFTRLDIAS